MWYLSFLFCWQIVKLRRNPAIEKKYVFIIKEMDISEDLVKFHGTLSLTELSRGAGFSIRSYKLPNFKQAFAWMCANDSDSILQSLQWSCKLLRTSNCKLYFLSESSIAAINGIYFISHTLEGPEWLISRSSNLSLFIILVQKRQVCFTLPWRIFKHPKWKLGT